MAQAGDPEATCEPGHATKETENTTIPNGYRKWTFRDNFYLKETLSEVELLLIKAVVKWNHRSLGIAPKTLILILSQSFLGIQFHFVLS